MVKWKLTAQSMLINITKKFLPENENEHDLGHQPPATAFEKHMSRIKKSSFFTWRNKGIFKCPDQYEIWRKLLEV